MMQFLWKYVDEMVGKGLEMNVLAQFFFYTALTLVPASLPLAILLAEMCIRDSHWPLRAISRKLLVRSTERITWICLIRRLICS